MGQCQCWRCPYEEVTDQVALTSAVQKTYHTGLTEFPPPDADPARADADAETEDDADKEADAGDEVDVDVDADVGQVILSAAELLMLMLQEPKDLRLLDVTKDGEPGYDSTHIEGAVFMDITYQGDDVPPSLESIPSPSVFQDYMRSLGINSGSNIIIYDQANANAGYLSAGRAWFLLRYHGHNNIWILDGGLAKWRESSYETTFEVPSIEEGNFRVNLRQELLMSFEDMVENLCTNAYQVYDTRSRAMYDAGHIPGAKSVPFGEKFINKEKRCLQTLPHLKKAFEEAGLNVHEPLIAMCRHGYSSCTSLVALAMMGYDKVPLYFGSWLEWEKTASDSQIETS